MGEVLSFKKIQVVLIAAIAALALGCTLSLGVQSAFAVGTTFDAGEGATAAKYTITSMDPLEVAYTETAATGNTIKVPATISYEGKTYSVTSIAKQACKGSKASAITVGANVKKIGNGAFRACPNLKKLVIGSGVTKLGQSMVKNCKNLKVVTIKSTKLNKKAVKNCFKGSSVKTVKVPKSKVASYKKIFTKANCGKKVKVMAI